MATVFDVAAYILAKRGEMTAWKLQKLVYYSQAWSLVWDQRPIFPGGLKLGRMARCHHRYLGSMFGSLRYRKLRSVILTR